MSPNMISSPYFRARNRALSIFTHSAQAQIRWGLLQTLTCASQKKMSVHLGTLHAQATSFNNAPGGPSRFSDRTRSRTELDGPLPINRKVLATNSRVPQAKGRTDSRPGKRGQYPCDLGCRLGRGEARLRWCKNDGFCRQVRG